MLSGVKGRNKASCYGFITTNQNEEVRGCSASSMGSAARSLHINANKARMVVWLASQGVESRAAALPPGHHGSPTLICRHLKRLVSASGGLKGSSCRLMDVID